MEINIRDLMQSKGISKYKMAKELKLSFPTMTAIYNGTTTNIKLDILEKICQILECTPNDIFVFETSFSETSINNSNFDFMNPPIK